MAENTLNHNKRKCDSTGSTNNPQKRRHVITNTEKQTRKRKLTTNNEWPNNLVYQKDPCFLFLNSLDFDGYNKWYTVPILLFYCVILRIMTYYVLKYVNHEKR